MKFVALVAFAVAIVGCSSMHYSAVQPGRPGITLDRPLEERVKSTLGNYLAIKLPAGHYTASFEDSRGVYYSSPGVTFWAAPPFGDSVITGGIFSPVGSTDTAKLGCWTKTTFETVAVFQFTHPLSSSDGVSFTARIRP